LQQLYRYSRQWVIKIVFVKLIESKINAAKTYIHETMDNAEKIQEIVHCL